MRPAHSKRSAMLFRSLIGNGAGQHDPSRHVRADATHLDAVAPLFDAYRGFYQQPSNLAQSRALHRRTHGCDESVIFLAQDEHGEALGFVQLYPTFSSIDAHRTWLLSDLFTTPAARGRGVGRLLMNTARDFALASRCQGAGAGNRHRQPYGARLVRIPRLRA